MIFDQTQMFQTLVVLVTWRHSWTTKCHNWQQLNW